MAVVKQINKHLLVIICLLLTFAVYFKFFFAEHLSWDDPEMVFQNRDVRHFDLQALFNSHYAGNYIPVTMLFHAMAWKIFGNSDAAHHGLNIFIHLINGILVYRLTLSLFNTQNISVITAIIFLLHPVQVESVGWIGELKTPLSSLFCFLSCILYVEFVKTEKIRSYIFSFLFFTVACLSKSSAVVIPIGFIAFDLILKNSFSLKFLLNKIPLLVVSIVFGIINLKTQSADQFINYSHAFPYAERVGFAGFALLKYLQLFFFPVKLSVLYPYPGKKIIIFAAGYFLIMALLVLFYFLIKKKQILFISLVSLCIIHLFLVLQFIPFGEVLYADRYMYVAIVFFAWLFVKGVEKIKMNANVLVYGLMLLLPLLTFFRGNAWKSSITLYSDIIKKFPDSFVALNSLGVEMMMRNEDAKALEYLSDAVKAAPGNYKAYYNRGLLFLKVNKPGAAVKSFDQAISLYDYPKAYVGRATAYLMMNDLSKSMNDAEYALHLDPDNLKAHYIIGNLYNQLNKTDEAIREYDFCISRANDESEYYFKRAIAYGKKGNFSGSLNDLSASIQLNSMNFEAYYWRAVAKVNLRQNPCEDLNIAARNGISQAMKALEKYCR